MREKINENCVAHYLQTTTLKISSNTTGLLSKKRRESRSDNGASPVATRTASAIALGSALTARFMAVMLSKICPTAYPQVVNTIDQVVGRDLEALICQCALALANGSERRPRF